MKVDGGKGLCTKSDRIQRAWLNLLIAITTQDRNEFYIAIGGNKLRNDKPGKHSVWEKVK